jgi:uncharacterized protein with beta-barrel porin domain
MKWLLIVGIVMLIVGAVFWADGEYDKTLGCSVNRTIDESSGLYTADEVKIRYDACIVNAGVKLRWSRPVCAIGASLTIAGGIGWLLTKMGAK